MAILKDPGKIEEKSFRIVDNFLSDFKFPSFRKDIVRRVIHATSDFDYAKKLLFHHRAIENGVEAIRKGKNIIVDASMVKAGINEKLLRDSGGRVICFINDKDIILKSRKLKITRSILAMRKASRLMDGAIVAVGNAPTALFEICDLIKKEKANPALVVGVPVGFVGASESKRKLLTIEAPYITNKGRKGGSSVAASIVNALLKIAQKRD